MSSWKTVPNFFPDYNDLSNETHYHLHEGCGIGEWESRPSGKYYKKIRFLWDDDRVLGKSHFDQLLRCMNCDNWWNRWRPNKSLWGRLCGSWKKTKEKL